MQNIYLKKTTEEERSFALLNTEYFVEAGAQ